MQALLNYFELFLVKTALDNVYHLVILLDDDDDDNCLSSPHLNWNLSRQKAKHCSSTPHRCTGADNAVNMVMMSIMIIAW